MNEHEQISIGRLSRDMEAELTPLYGVGEAKAMTRLIFHHIKGWNLTDMIIHSDNEASDYILDSVRKILERLKTHEPLQYILGEAYFYGMNLKVNEATLIPRPETAELVDLIVKDFKDKKDLRILDVGTGSGAIAIALARNLPFADMRAIDISAEAVEIAKENAANLKAKVKFSVADIFTLQPETDSLDIIVSNPPYIDESEKKDMDRNVLDFEPHSALFVPDSDPLRFYIAIAGYAMTALSAGGALYFEINPLRADDMKIMLSEKGFTDIRLHRDISGKFRFIDCRKQ